MFTGPTSRTTSNPQGSGLGNSTRATEDRPTPGSTSLEPPPGLPKRKPLGGVMAALRSHRAALPRAQGQAAGSAAPTSQAASLDAMAGPSAIAAAQPALDPKHHGDLLRRMAVYEAVTDGLQQRLEDGALDLPARCRHHLMDLHEATRELESLRPYLLEGKSPPHGGGPVEEVKAMRRYLQMELQARASLRELVVDQPQHILPLLGDNMNSLSYVAENLSTVLQKNHEMLSATSEDLGDYVQQLRRDLKNDSQRSLREAEVQSGILSILGSAVQGFSQERMDHHRHSAGGWLGRHGGARTSYAAGMVGMNVVKPETYGTKIHSELIENFGAYFDIQTSGEKKVELSIKPEVPGSMSTQALLKELEFMNDFLGARRDREAVKAAIKASPDVQWVREDGVDRLALTPAALERMAIDEAAGKVLILAPLERLRACLLDAAEGVKLSELKAALVNTFREDYDALVKRANFVMCGITHGDLTYEKAELVEALLNDLLASPDARHMLARIDHAIADHDALWKGSWQARDGGTTGALLADMRTAVQRYGQDLE